MFTMKSREFLFCMASSLAVFPTVTHATEPPKAAESVNAPVILKMMQRDRIITVKSEGAKALYTVETKDGKVLAKDVKLDELKAQNPDLYKQVKDAVAGASGILDASNAR